MAGARRANLGQPQSESDALLRRLAEGTASTVGELFFHSLTRNLAAALGVRYAFIAEVDPSGRRVTTLAFWTGEEFTANFEYDLDGTPCQHVLRGEVCHFPEGVQAQFPQDRDLVKLSAQSYLAVPLSSPDGQVLGHLAVLDVKPMPLAPEALSILKIFGARAGAELERKRLEEANRRSEYILRKMDEGTAATVGEEFFSCMVRNLADALQVRHAFVSEIVEGKPARVRPWPSGMGSSSWTTSNTIYPTRPANSC